MFFQKTIYKVKIIDLKKIRLYKVSSKVATFVRKFRSGKKFPIKRKWIEKVQICENAPTPLIFKWLMANLFYATSAHFFTIKLKLSCTYCIMKRPDNFILNLWYQVIFINRSCVSIFHFVNRQNKNYLFFLFLEEVIFISKFKKLSLSLHF